jgi:hypothetical protein
MIANFFSNFELSGQPDALYTYMQAQVDKFYVNIDI